MDYSFILYGLLFLSAVYLLIAVFALRHPEVEGSRNFAVMVIAAAVYCVGYFFELQSADEQIASAWIRFQYLGASGIPALLLLFTIQYCGRSQWLTPMRTAAIWFIPIATALISNSAYVHHLLYTEIEIEFIHGLTITSYDKLPIYYIYYVYVVLTVLAGLALLMYSYIRFKQDPNSKRFLLLFLGAMIPWLTYIFFDTSNSPLNLDLVPMTLFVTTGIFIYNTYTYNMFRSVSITKNVLFDAFKDGIVITNEQNRIVDMNLRSVQYFGSMNKRMGMPVESIIGNIQREGYWNNGDRKIWFDIQKNNLEKNVEGKSGRVYIFRDITKQMETQEALAISEEKYYNLFEHMQEGFALHEMICNDEGQPIDYRFLDINRAFERMTGLRRDDIINRRVLEVFPGTESYWIDNYGKVALEETSITFENYSKETGKYFSVTAFSPKKGQFAVIFFDITDRIALEKETVEEKERLRTTLLSVGDGVVVTDKDANVLMINEIAQKLTGYSEAEACGRSFADIFHIVNTETLEKCTNPVLQVFQTGKIENLEERTILIAKDGTKTHIADSAAPIKDNDGNIRGVVIVFRDVTEEQRYQEKITYISYHDQLTGLYNRRYFEEQITRIDTLRNLPISIIIIDVNGLKLINDAFGHAIGDQLIQKTAEVIQAASRADEIIAR